VSLSPFSAIFPAISGRPYLFLVGKNYDKLKPWLWAGV